MTEGYIAQGTLTQFMVRATLTMFVIMPNQVSGAPTSLINTALFFSYSVSNGQRAGQ